MNPSPEQIHGHISKNDLKSELDVIDEIFDYEKKPAPVAHEIVNCCNSSKLIVLTIMVEI